MVLSNNNSFRSFLYLACPVLLELFNGLAVSLVWLMQLLERNVAAGSIKKVPAEIGKARPK